MSNSTLLEAIAAAILDGTTLTFSPAEPNGTSLPTGMVVGVRLDRNGRVYHSTGEVGFGGLSLSHTADAMLADIVNEIMAPVIHAALDDEDTGEIALDDLTLEQEPTPA
jgi:hypothetical protein